MIALTEYGIRLIGNLSLGRTWTLPPPGEGWPPREKDVPLGPSIQPPSEEGGKKDVPPPSPVSDFLRRYGIYILIGIAVLSILRSRRR